MVLGVRVWRGWEMTRFSAHLNYDAKNDQFGKSKLLVD